jgi:isopentenyl-diphosphate delta-isomerase
MIGTYNEPPIINTTEVAAYQWMTLEDVKSNINLHPEIYTEWFKIIFNEFYNHIS